MIVSLAVVLVVGVVGAFYLSKTNSTPSIKIISPASGDVLMPGSTYKVQWNTQNIPASNKISVIIRRIPPPALPEEGQEFDPIIFTSIENTGSKDWTVSDMYPAGNYVLEIISYASIPVTDNISAESAQFRTEGPAIGGQQDEHGCLIAAGYSWCDAKKKCIRQWEEYCTAATPQKVTFNCSDSKTITATFYPADDKYVDLQLSDGRNMSVPRAISASGARYAKSDESFVFWNKGDNAFITEGANSTETYSACVLKK